MIKGITFALGACFIWGLIFVVPQFMTGFTSIEVALGRYFVYGVVSLVIFCKSKLQGPFRHPRAIWMQAVSFSLISTIVYYTFLVLALRYATPAVAALIGGISPITIAFYGNWKQKETTFKSLIIPSVLILIGLLIINIPHFEETVSVSAYILGLCSCLLALVAWSWYVVANARFLKNHPQIRASNWSTLMGVVTLFWVAILALFLAVFFENQLHMEKYFTASPELTRFLIGSSILGILCSWVGAFLWNKASVYLPVSLAGQITIFETIFGVLFVYILERHMPPLTECIGIVVLLSAVVYGIRQFSKRKAYNNQLTPH